MEKINLDEDTSALIAWLATATGLTTSDIIDRLLSAHLPELWELRAFLETHATSTEQHEQGKNLLASFGPEPIMSGIKRIAPDHVTLETQFLHSMNASTHNSGAGQ